MTKAPVPIGLVGAGRWGRNFISTLREIPGITLSRIASSNPATAALVDAGCTIHGDWQDLVSSNDIEGVIIATPPATHAVIASRAIMNNKAVLIEKPLTTDLQSALSLKATADAHHAIALVNHIHLYNPAWAALKNAAQHLGPLLNVQSEAGAPGPIRTDVSVLWDWAPHDVALGLDITGAMPTSAVCRKLISHEVPEGIAEQLSLKLNFPNQVTMHSEIGTLFKEKRRWLRADFRQGTLVFDDRLEDKVTMHEAGDSLHSVGTRGTPIPFEVGSPLEKILGAFASCIRAGQSFLSDLALAVQVVEVISRLERFEDIGSVKA